LPSNTAAERRLLAALAFHRLIWGETTGPEVGRVAERALGGGRLLTDAGVGHPSVLAALSVLQAVDRDNEVEGALREARRLGGSRGGAREEVILAALEARLALFRGQLREAGAAAHEALQIATAAGSESGRQLALACLVPVLVERGELDAAEAALGSTGTDTHNSAAFGTRWLMLQARMALRQAQGRFAEAAGDARRALAERAGQAGRPLPGAGRLALALDAAGEREQARRLAAASAGHARRWGVRSTLGVALRIAGLVEGGERGLALLDDAAQALAATRRRLEYARALVELGAAQRRANRRSDAREPLAEGMELAHRCGARPLVGRARDELRACGARPRRPVRSGVDALTPSELRVAQHAAAGLTNREIAQTLFVSRKTVETHLAAVYRKLHVNRRDALAERLAGDGKAASAPPRRGAPVRRD
jgi:ATP/maltotriose-dependent transcriptional regulator MalT